MSGKLHDDDFRTILLTVSTEDLLIKKKSNSDFKFDLAGGVIDNVKRLAIKGLSFRNNVYNINSFTNTLSFTAATVPTVLNTITIPNGNYDITTLIPALETAIDAIITPSTVSITQDALTQKLTFTVTGGEAIRFFDSNQSDATLIPPLEPSLNTMARFIGIISDQGLNAVTTLGGLPALNGLDYIYVHSNDLADSNLRSSNGTEDVIDVVPVIGGFFSKNFYLPADDDLNSIEYTDTKSINGGDIQLRDQYNNILEMNGGHVSIVFKLWILNF